MTDWRSSSSKGPGHEREMRPARSRGEKGTREVTSAPSTFKSRRLTAMGPEELESSIREAYFAIASWVALRYDVQIDDVIGHLQRAGVHNATRPAAAVQYVEDVVLAVAACQGNRQAWLDAAQIFDLTLVRACTLRLPEQDAVMYVRRFLADLEVETLDPSGCTAALDGDGFEDEPHEGDGGLRAYAGLRPLRVWLTDRLLARLEREVPAMRVHLGGADEAQPLKLVD